MKFMKRCLSLLIAVSIMLSMVVSMAMATTEDDLQVVPLDAKEEVISNSTQACNDAWAWTGDGDKIATLPHGEIYADQIYVAAVANGYWTDYKYSAEATTAEVTFTSGEDLVSIALRVRNESAIWGGADCVFAEITPTAAAEAITEDTTVSGTFKLFYAAWGTYCNVPFSVTIKVKAQETPEPGEGDGLPAYTETISDSADYANSGNGQWNATPGLVEATIGPREKYTLAIAGAYWANTSVSGYSETPTELVPTFTCGDGLLTFSVKIAAGPIWGGASCEMLTITPTDAAYALTEDTTVTGTIRIYWRGYCDMPFSVTIKVEAEDMGTDQLLYDDRLVLSTTPKNAPVIQTVEVLSNDSVTGEKDTAVIAYDAATNALVAVGVGTAKVTIDGKSTTYTVSPAPISLFVFIGASMGQGYGGSAAQSIANAPGQVYSTYSGDLADQMTTADGLGLGFGSAARPDGIDANCTGGGGTIGAGSGLAYSWNRLTGEKVWIVNTAHGGTTVNTWQPGTADYDHTVEQMGYVQQILSREVQAGHYTFSHMGAITHTSGNNEDCWEASIYQERFEAMCAGLRADLACDFNGDNTKETLEFFALVPSWKNSIMYELDSNPFSTAKSHSFTKGRLLNYANGVLADYPDMFLASSYARQWLTDEGVAAYYAQSGEQYDTNYPTQNGVALSEPTKRSGGIYGDGVHYNQLGYNTAGMHIAHNIYAYLQNPVAESVTVYNEDGLTKIENGYKMAVGDDLRIAAIPEPICVNNLTFVASGSIELTGLYTIKAVMAGTGTLTIKQGSAVVKTITFEVMELPTYTHTISDSADYANYGGNEWNVAPKLIQLDIGTREKYSMALAGAYWAATENTGYCEEPTRLPVTFTTGEGLLEAYVTLEAGPIWGGAQCEMLHIVPTAAAYELTEATVVTGEIDIYWRGYTRIPFSIGLVPAGEEAPDHGSVLPAYTETISNSTDYASYGGSEWNVEPKTVEATIGPREKYTLALATSYWANPEVSGYSAEPTQLNATFTNGEGLLEFSVKLAAGPIWSGAECELLTITPTDAAYALTEDITVTGEIDIYWRGPVQMPFSITIDVPDSGSEGGGEDEQPGGEEEKPESNKTEVISSSTQAAGDDWNWTGDDDKIASLPYGEIKVSQIYVAAVATNYWTNNTYTTTATPTTVTFTEGEGLVTIALRLRKEEVIWYGAECVYAEITPTAAAEAITEPVKVSGTFQMHYAPWGKACEVPFEILLKPDDGDNRAIVPLKDMTNQVSEAVGQMIAGAENIPYVHEVISADNIYRGLFLRKEMLNYLPCVTDGIKCSTVLGYTANDLKIKVTKNADLADFSVEIARHDGDAWGDCFYITLKPTDKAKTVEPKTYVGGVFYFEKNGHKSREIPFRFFFEEAGDVPQLAKYVMLSDMVNQAYNAFTTVRVGGTMTPIHATLQYGEDYRGMLMREAMLPYISCEQENTYCYMLKQYGNEDLVIDVQTNAHLINIRTELAAHDGPAWGNCFYLYATLTEAAKDVAPGTAITGEIYFQKDGHKTRAIPFVFSVEEENAVLTAPYDYPWTAEMEMIIMGDFAEQVNDYIIATRNGTRLEPVTFVFQPGFKYAGNVMTTAMIPFVLCETDGIYCPESLNFAAENLVATFTQNGDLVKDIRFEVADYAGWGVDCIYMFVTFTERAMQAERGTLIDCLLSFQCNGHKTQDIQLKMYLFENPDRDKEDSGTRVVEDEEEEPTVPTPEQQKPQPAEQDNSLVLILALAAAALLLVLVLLVLLLLLKKKREAAAEQ